MKIIGVVGLPASGKGEFSRIANEMNIPVVIMGDVVRNAVRDAGLKMTDKNMGEMSRQLREGLGRDALAQLTISLIESRNSPVVLVDGIRSDGEVETFRSHFDDFVLVGIRSPFEIRARRLKSRGRSDDVTDEISLRSRDERELGWGLGAALEMSEYTLNNEGTIESFEGKVRDILKKIGSEK